jgi:hypothetical protein
LIELHRVPLPAGLSDPFHHRASAISITYIRNGDIGAAGSKSPCNGFANIA